MTAQSSIPLKWYVPFAQGDSSRVEIPVTTADPTRASQTLGFPPLTMQPPESGGVPPQGEDFNGGMNQVARIAWWVLNGGGWPYDSTFATNSNINGYPTGAKLQSADFRGDWISLADNNQTNPDTGTGATWVPGFQYGTTALTGLTGGTVTLTPAQASKNGITLTGTLGSALTLVVPNWTKNWTITNNTTGAFVAIVKTAAGSGITIPQNGSPTRVAGDGTNVTQAPENIANASSPTHAVPMSQAAGVVGSARNVFMNIATASASGTLTASEIIVETALGGTRYCLSNFSQTINLATTGANGTDVGAAPVSGFVAIYAIYNPSTGASALLAQNANALRTEVYSGANPVSGYTASALLGVVQTNASSQFPIGYLAGRKWSFVDIQVYNANAIIAGQTLSLATAVPINAKRCDGWITAGNTAAAASSLVSLYTNSAGVGRKRYETINQGAGSNNTGSFSGLEIATAQSVWLTVGAGTGTPGAIIDIVSYEV